MTTENQPARMGDDAVAQAFREQSRSYIGPEGVESFIEAVEHRARELSAHGGEGGGALPATLGPVAMEWYSLCERAPHAEQINITGELAAAIVKTITDGTGPLGGPIGWVFQHEETGRMTFCENDGINAPEVFARLNAGHILCGPAFSHSAATQQPASGEVVAIHQHRFLCQCPPHDQFCRCNDRWEDVNADYYQRYVKPNNAAEEWRIVYTTPATAAHGGSGEAVPFGWYATYQDGSQELIFYRPTDPDIEDIPRRVEPLYTAPVSLPPHIRKLAYRLIDSALDSDASGRPEGTLGDTAMELRQLLDKTPPTSASEGEVAFYVQPHLVEMCRQIGGVQKEHRVVVATEATGSHTVPLFTRSPARVGGDAVDAERWREVSDKAWFVDAAGYAYGLREGSFAPTCDPDDVTAAIDAAREVK